MTEAHEESDSLDDSESTARYKFANSQSVELFGADVTRDEEHKFADITFTPQALTKESASNSNINYSHIRYETSTGTSERLTLKQLLLRPIREPQPENECYQMQG